MSNLHVIIQITDKIGISIGFNIFLKQESKTSIFREALK